jgi:hypothetical protein
MNIWLPWARKQNRDVTIIATAVDLHGHQPSERSPKDRIRVQAPRAPELSRIEP